MPIWIYSQQIQMVLLSQMMFDMYEDLEMTDIRLIAPVQTKVTDFR